MRFLIFLLFILNSQMVVAQWEDITISQIDSRFTLQPKRHWSKLGGYEEYRFYVKNNTGDEYKIVVNVTLDLACFGTRNFTLGYNKVVYLKPHGKFDAVNDDYAHVFTSGAGNHKDCRLKDGDSYTLFRSMRYTISNVVNLTQEKAEAEKKAKEEKERKEIAAAEQKAQKEKDKQQAIKKEQAKQTANSSNSSNAIAGGSANGSIASSQLAEQEQASGTEQAMDDFWNAQKQRDEYIKKQSAIIDNTTKNLVQSYYAAEAVSKAKDNLSKSATLQGDFNSVEELEAAFQRQLNAIYESADALKTANSNNVKATYNTVYSNATEQQKVVGQAIAGIGEIWGEANAEKKEREAIAQLEAERATKIKEIEEKKRQQIIALRKQLFEKFADGGVPLSYHRVNQDELYFFAYIFDSNTISNNYTSIKISNVFPIVRYKDGSWIFKNSLKKKIDNGGTGSNITLIGYYTSKKDAEDIRQSFINMLAKTNVTVSNFEFKGMKASASTSTSTNKDADIDFWGNKKEAKEENTTKKNSFWD